MERISSERLDRLFREASELPMCPGVYIMRSRGGQVIYVGKSRALRSRVSQYFANTEHAVKTERMVSMVDRFDTIICKTEIEALTLENALIKQYEPRYNIKLKDAKSYPYIKISIGDDYPRLTMTRKRGAEKSTEALYFGPYSSAGAVRDIISSMERVFKLPACKHEFPRDIGRVSTCVYDQMGRCCGVCRGDVPPDEYKENMKAVISVLRGDTASARAELEAKMNEFSESLNFEAAARCRDSIAALERLKERQHVVASPEVERDVISYYADPDGICSCATLLVIRGGAVADKQSFEFGAAQLMDENGISGEGGMTEFITMLYAGREYVPREVLVSFAIEDEEAALLSEYLSKRAGYRVTVRTPERGEGKERYGGPSQARRTAVARGRAGDHRMLRYIKSRRRTYNGRYDHGRIGQTEKIGIQTVLRQGFGRARRLRRDERSRIAPAVAYGMGADARSHSARRRSRPRFGHKRAFAGDVVADTGVRHGEGRSP